MSDRFPADPYRENVLQDCFEDAKRYLLEHYLDVDRAHIVMLCEQGIVARADGALIARAVESLDLDEIRRAAYDGSVEDLFFWLQRQIADACGDTDVAGRLHTARSRNDIDVTIYRLQIRRQVIELLTATRTLHRVLLDLAASHHESLMPAHTHTQPAQPTTVAHFLLAMAENCDRDQRRLQSAYDNLNECPLGACAITTTGFPIDRHRVAALLGFERPTGNSYASIASVDYFVELAGAGIALLVNVGRFAQEFLQMSMVEFDALRLPDGYVQTSSIMPQKRNPVALEHVRAIGSKALGQLLGVCTAVHNTPFGDINDVEDDLQPLVYSGLRDACRAVGLLGASLGSATFNTEHLARRAGADFITVTELADTIVRDAGLPFSKAHALVARCVAAATEQGGDISYSMLQEAARAVTGNSLPLDEETLARVLTPEYFVAVRQVHGGPAPEETRRALGEQVQRHDAHVAWLGTATSRLAAAAGALSDAVASLAASQSADSV